jgi:6-pyruvoyltetrahydropterin/6-carboxytetrahydropterin synthase
MPEVTLVRRYRFSASHRLHSPALSDAENREAYGKCNNEFGHGHNYELEVRVRGQVSAESGRAIPLAALDRFVEEVLLRDLDRRNLNVEVEEFATLVPTTENLAMAAAERLSRAWPRWFGRVEARPDRVKIRETRNNTFEVAVPRSNHSLTVAAQRNAGRKPALQEGR